MPIYKDLRVKLGYSGLPHRDYVVLVTGIYDGLHGNPKFPDPPVSLADLKEKSDRYKSAVAAAADGSKTVMAERGSLRDELNRMIRQLGHYVEHQSDNDPAVFVTSGFESLPSTQSSAQPLTPPRILKIKHGYNSGALLISLSPSRRRIIHYELRHGVFDGEQVTGPWTTSIVNIAKGPVTVSDLKAGTVYAFQVRAYGKLGFTDWSDSITKMCT